jgi:hypothetical protein
MKGYTKQDVEQHGSGFGDGQPAVNVKSRTFPTIDQVVERFGCSEETAQQALEFAFESHQGSFWESAQEVAQHYFGPCVVYSEGHSGGWLVIAPKLERGLVTMRSLLPDVEGWDAITLNKWALFERCLQREVEYLCSWEAVEASIDANAWAEDQTAIEGMLEVANA